MVRVKLAKNPEIKVLFIVYGIFTIIASFGGVLISVPCGVYICVVCVVLGAIFYFFLRQRYKKISELNDQLDNILHGNYSMELIPDKEGELAILSSEIYKMTVRMREQAEMLERDKTYLSNSIADISHQLRTPLTSVCMIIPRLQRENLEETERIQLARELNSLLSRIEWLVSSLLKISQLESGTVSFRFEDIYVKELVKKAIEPLEIPIELNEQTIDIEIREEIHYTGDFSWSVEAIGNILKNCMEHTPFGGRLYISAEENPVYTEITISDSGAGIEPEDLPHIFERFYKGKNTGKNSGKNNIGIGLALSRIIIHKQNGSVKAENNKDGGAKFQIRFYKGAV